ncbi:hypothetical protein SmJEL517_g06152 [Synchytrium microbalum]|uniref:Uncharacterized protein n=1 Tax=Synchytrium microbalum TaxID=1806994 RepID=A0A507BWW6_9FUNG|nr:uncharacterized protein SmJEL517_g06152 [Synchytrium microbalum]TPX30246.1 hypothetical protein SmJEL517_g06152 [Synchytrium microbalum]
MPTPDISKLPVTYSDVAYNKRDLILYAIGIGENDLKFTYELNKDFAAFPTFPIHLPFRTSSNVTNFLERGGHAIPGIKLDLSKVVDGERYIEILNPLPLEGKFRFRTKITGVFDTGKATVVQSEATMIDANSKEYAKVLSSTFYRDAGGFGGEKPPKPSLDSIPPPRPADNSLSLPTLKQQAVIYRLSGDYNPLHIDPTFANQVGFPTPILHGPASYGIAARAILKLWGENDPSRFKSFRARFISPVLPGETLRVDSWLVRDEFGCQTISFTVTVVERNIQAIGGGVAKQHPIPIESGDRNGHSLHISAVKVPALRNLATSTASILAILVLKTLDPQVVGIRLTSSRSLTPNGTPHNGGSNSPHRCLSIHTALSYSAACSDIYTNALITGLISLMRARCAMMDSVGVTAPDWIKRQVRTVVGLVCSLLRNQKPGDSDGTSKPGAGRLDAHCNPTNTVLSLGASDVDALPNALEAGQWLDDEFVMLVGNATPLSAQGLSGLACAKRSNCSCIVAMVREYSIPNDSLIGKTIIVTGGNFGLGRSATESFALAGAKVIIASRSLERATSARNEIMAVVSRKNANGMVEVMTVDISSMKSVKAFAASFLARDEQLDILVCNAGLIAKDDTKTSEGFELHFALAQGHFLLTLLLLPALKKASNARVVTLSSAGHVSAIAGIDYEKVHGDKVLTKQSTKEVVLSYGVSKLANIYYSRWTAQQLKGTRITSYSLHPGAVSTGIWKFVPSALRWMIKYVTLTEEQGARTILYCAVDEKAGKETGLYYEDCAVKRTSLIGSDDKKAVELVETSGKWLNVDVYSYFKGEVGKSDGYL